MLVVGCGADINSGYNGGGSGLVLYVKNIDLSSESRLLITFNRESGAYTYCELLNCGDQYYANNAFDGSSMGATASSNSVASHYPVWNAGSSGGGGSNGSSAGGGGASSGIGYYNGGTIGEDGPYGYGGSGSAYANTDGDRMNLRKIPVVSIFEGDPDGGGSYNGYAGGGYGHGAGDYGGVYRYASFGGGAGIINVGSTYKNGGIGIVCLYYHNDPL